MRQMRLGGKRSGLRQRRCNGAEGRPAGSIHAVWTRWLYGGYTACFAAVILSAGIYAGNRSPEELLETALGVPLCLLGLHQLNCGLERQSRRIEERRYHAVLGVFAVGMFLCEFGLALSLRHGVWFDVEAIFSGAVLWAETGNFSGYYEYFEYFPNNLGGLTFLCVLFKVGVWLGFRDYYALSALAACAVLTASMVLASLVCRRLAGVRCGVLALLLFLLSPQFLFLGGAVYTDVLSMLFPILFLYLYLRFLDSSGGKKIWLAAVMGLTMAAGSLIKATVLIMAAAVLIHALLRCGPAKAGWLGLWVLVLTAAAGLLLNAALYTTQLSLEEARERNTPLLHWVMMGLRGDGLYNPQDYEFTRSLPPEGRNQALLREIGVRIREKGPVGMAELLLRKSAIDFGDGTYGADDFLKIPPYAEDSPLHQIVLQDGKYHSWYRGYATAMHLALMVYMLLGSHRLAAGNQPEQADLRFPLYLALFGLWLFLMLWETNRRYFSNFAPVLITCGVLAIPGVGEEAKEGASGEKQPEEDCMDAQAPDTP